MLRHDADYYGEFGKQFLSNSDLKTLRENPREFGKQREDSKAFIEGRYFHTAILEPTKLPDIPVSDAKSRNSNAYKEFLSSRGIDVALLMPEVMALEAMIKNLKANTRIKDMIYAEGNKYEEPAIGEILGHMFKGKADIVTDQYVIDIKTTGDIDRFKYSARDYGYDTQAYIYQKLFGKPLIFIAMDKKSHKIGVYYPQETFLEKAEAKIKQSLDIYNRFFSEDSIESLEEWVIEEPLI